MKALFPPIFISWVWGEDVVGCARLHIHYGKLVHSTSQSGKPSLREMILQETQSRNDCQPWKWELFSALGSPKKATPCK